MKRFTRLFILFLGIVSMFIACQKAPFITMTGPRTFNFPSNGGTQSITFTCNRTWSVASTDSWVQVSPSSGSASDENITVKITCSPNSTYDSRSAVLTIKVDELSESITVNQDTGLGLFVSPTSFELTNAAQTIEIEVQKNVQYSVAIDNDCIDWIKQGGTKALTTDRVTFSISENTSYDKREGKIVLKQIDGNLTQTITVCQSQTNGLFITTPDYNLSNEAHTLSVEVKSNVEFEVNSQNDWITLVETKALTPSTITLKVEANEAYDNRTGTVLVKQTNGDLTGTITINQKQTDFMSASPTSFEVSNEAQDVTIKVKDNVSYSVVIPDEAKSWIRLSSNTQTKALVDDEVVLAIAENSSFDDREASVTIKQVDGALTETVNIKQAHREGLFVEKTEYEITRAAQALQVGVTANIEYEVYSDSDWVKYVETKALSASTVSLSIEANATTSYRFGKVVIKQKDGALSQTITVKQQPLPQIQTLEVTDLDYFSATLNGCLKVENASSITQGVWFYFGKYDNLEDLISKGERVASALNGDDTFIKSLSELNYCTKYYYVAVASILNDTFYGEVKSFATLDIPEVVDLGLSVKWRSWNLGASKPEEFGDYYAWGETETKEEYSWATYKWCNGSPHTLTKYNYSNSCGIVDNLDSLEENDDAAHVKLGGGWRIPQANEIIELKNNCKEERFLMNGVWGVKFTSKIIGYSGKFIFLPAAGSAYFKNQATCLYWGSLVNRGGSPENAWSYEYPEESCDEYTENGNRFDGYSIRPVME